MPKFIKENRKPKDFKAGQIRPLLEGETMVDMKKMREEKMMKQKMKSKMKQMMKSKKKMKSSDGTMYA